ncbi:hypothetical protein XM38_028420 [Halomicronema hongdechloris C2206]|uniref:Uncharacterized protein n=1 Tax=Halomicronema hongdechloris C2206 TaxID=1641165 RepID=A0A1Z3HNJ9_9CYAN|nr:hypothetical protein [Halomicronema hongdechloris]ASC71888.1 hypothetical protein XM38_028420 [Halomicronema hongdechloris C2206]
MTELGTYTFLPWLRQGIANRINATDLDPAVKTRASVPITLKLKGDPIEGTTPLEQEISQDIELYGPGDIVGIDSKAILKVEPRNWITNFETNFLPHIEFPYPDFPWLYTPAKPDNSNNRLRPWIMLVVLTEEEFQQGSSGSERPLPYLIVEDPSVFPPSADLWAWAHVHINKSLMAGSTDMVIEADENDPVLAQLQQTLKQNPDLAYSRIVSPRKLAPNTAYHAFLMPVFETGRLAGLGLDPITAPYATHCAWDAYPEGASNPRQEPTHYPVYYRWYFRTSTAGDFEYLVRLLKPKPMDSRVGRRDMDVQFPDANLPGITDPELGGVLKLGGALQIPFDTLKEEDQQEVLKYENWDQPYPHPFQSELAAFINLAEGYSRLEAETANSDPNLPDPISTDPDPDPLITPPLYGRWHAKMQRLLTDETGNDLPQNSNWVHDLNLDPRFRAAAGFGTEVIKKNQEAYMDAAWGQVGEILKANQQIKWAQVAKEISWIWYNDHLGSLKDTNPDRFFTLTAPLDRRILVEGTTRFHAMRTSYVPRTAVAAPMRRMMRSRSRLIKKLNFPANRPPESLVTRLNNRDVFPAPPKTTPPSLPTLDELAEEMLPQVPGIILDLVRRIPSWLRFLILLLIALIVALLWGLAGLIVGILALIVFFYLNAIGRQTKAADSLKEENQTPERVDDLPQSPDFVLTRPNEDVRPSQGNADSAEATRFKAALKDTYRLIQASHQVAQEPPKSSLDLPALTAGTFQAINPDVTIPRATLTTIFIPPRIKDALFEIFEEAMAYPEFDIPMYKPLVEISDELFLPNLQYIEQNSISLLETNQRFIEAYMVGLNHEFARELLWREYPTYQRGSYFRQFWDVSSFLDRDNTDQEALKERLRDIPPLHRWSRFSNLGDHDHREAQGDKEEELVLVIRGELLKKYPTAVIYAQRADWQLTDDGEIDKTKPRMLCPLAADEEENPPPDKIRTPLYEAKVDPDTYCFGIDLKAEEARGETETNPDFPGWFFVIEERGVEPRFGFDIDQDGAGGGTKRYWNDLSWEDVLPGSAAGSFVRPTMTPGVALDDTPPASDEEGQRQHAEDVQVTWTGSVSAAEMAYIMYQVPVRVAVHASEMLPE